MEIDIWRVGKRAVRVERQAAVGGATDESRGQRIAVHIGIVDQHANRRDGQRRVLVGRIAVSNGHRRVVDRHHDHVEGCLTCRRVACIAP